MVAGGERPRAGDAVELRFPRLGGTRVRLEGERPGTGMILRLAGPRLAGSLEWYLEPFKEGTIVNAILELEPGRRGHGRARAPVPPRPAGRPDRAPPGRLRGEAA